MEWIKTKDKYPDEMEHVLVFANDIVSSWIEIAYMEDGEWHTPEDYHWPCLVDAWMKLPEPPK